MVEDRGDLLETHDFQITELTLENFTPEVFEPIRPLTKGLTFEMVRENLRIRLEHGEVTVVAFAENKMVGLFSATINQKLDGTKIGFMEDMYVLPEFRSQGIATAMELYMLDRMWQIGCSEILGRVAETNAVMNEIHSRCGGQIQPGHWWSKKNPNLEARAMKMF